MFANDSSTSTTQWQKDKAKAHQQSIAKLQGVSKDFPLPKSNPHKEEASDKNQKQFLSALKQVDLDIYAGEVVAILGPNGAGKTSLINLMLGRLKVTQGEILVLGLKPGCLALKRHTGAMLQVATLPENVRVNELLTLFRSYYPDPMAYDELVELAGLTSFTKQNCKDLSGGQKQRLLFALAICGNPKLLFLDEPSVGMDVQARKSLWRAIEDLKSRGTSIILTTHYLEEADKLADKIVMLSHGKVVRKGTPESIKAEFDRRTVSFSCSIGLDEISTIEDVLSVNKKHNNFIVETKNPVSFLRFLFAKCPQVCDLSVTGDALEEAFLKLNDKNQEELTHAS